jgi:hypothetical protein
MFKNFKTALFAAAGTIIATSAAAFSLLGPGETWQADDIGYDPFGFDIGGPHNLGEEYRVNFPVMTYGFDESFLNYFGSAGTAAVHSAMTVLNNLPPVSQMSSNLAEFPTDAKRFNFQASALNLLDLKSHVLGAMVEQLGLASPERWAWALRNRREFSVGMQMFTNYLVIQRNFDPVTWQPTPYVNDVLYTYQVQEFTMPDFADAVEFTVDPLANGFTSVASVFGGLFGGGIQPGEFFDGITRDDAGGLRYLLRTNNFQIELLANGANLIGTTNLIFPPHLPAGTGIIETNAPVNQTIRPGVDKVSFIPHAADSLVGAFFTITNTYTDRYVTNSTLVSQTVQRVITQPDILFSAEDLGVVVDTPFLFLRTETTGWQNNNAINGLANLAGPGVIQGPVVLTFSKLGPYFFNQFPGFVDESTAIAGVFWGSFDGSANPPIVFPLGLTVQDLENQILNP